MSRHFGSSERHFGSSELPQLRPMVLANLLVSVIDKNVIVGYLKSPAAAVGCCYLLWSFFGYNAWIGEDCVFIAWCF
jgi:hypothetical protein